MNKTPKTAEQIVSDARQRSREYMSRRRANDPEWAAHRRMVDSCFALARYADGHDEKLQEITDLIRARFDELNSNASQGVNE